MFNIFFAIVTRQLFPLIFKSLQRVIVLVVLQLFLCLLDLRHSIVDHHELKDALGYLLFEGLFKRDNQWGAALPDLIPVCLDELVIHSFRKVDTDGVIVGGDHGHVGLLQFN